MKYDICTEVSIHMKIQNSFGKRIRLLRKERGLSQERFALLINMDRTYYSSVESGKRNISLQNIVKIARGLNVPIADLFKDIEMEDIE